jgi:hypothetical protein
MRRTEGGYRAHGYDRIQAPDARGYLDKGFYAVEGLPGLWRRVRDPGVSDPVAKGVVAAFFQGGLIYLAYDEAAARELQEGGYSTELALCTQDAVELVARLVVNRRKVLGPSEGEGGGSRLASDPADPTGAGQSGGQTQTQESTGVGTGTGTGGGNGPLTESGYAAERAATAAAAGAPFPNSPTSQDAVLGRGTGRGAGKQPESGEPVSGGGVCPGAQPGSQPAGPQPAGDVEM